MATSTSSSSSSQRARRRPAKIGLAAAFVLLAAACVPASTESTAPDRDTDVLDASRSLKSNQRGTAPASSLAPPETSKKTIAGDEGKSGGTSGSARVTEPSPSVPSAGMRAPGSAGSGGVPPGLSVAESLIPVGDEGVSGPRIGAAQYSKRVGDGSAAFRTNCRYSHMLFDDPIVAPGRERMSHLHIFFGNTAVDAFSTPESVRSSGSSTCTGGTANRSAYWAPAVVDTVTGAPVINDAAKVDQDHFLQVYYKSGYDGVVPQSVQNFPVGLRMVAGDMSSTGPQSGVASYSCREGSAAEVNHISSFPDCAPGQLFIMSIDFPQCWDGVNLDSPDHKSHMSYGAGWPDLGCPSTHPVPLAQITQNFRYRVPASGMSTWRLSSDTYDGPAGYSGHADWMNGWDPAVFQRVVDNCYRGGFDCQMNLLGDGQTLN